MDENLLTIVTYVLCVALGFGLYFLLTKLGISKAHGDATKIVEEANSKADNIVKEAILDAKTQAYEYKLEAEKEIQKEAVSYEHAGYQVRVHFNGDKTLSQCIQNLAERKIAG